VADRYSTRVRVFMWTVSALSVPLLAVTGWQALELGLGPLLGHLGIVVVLFSVVLVAGEMWPIPVSRGEESSDEITVSSTFGFALLLVAPVFFTILAQAVALVIDWRVRGRSWQALLFNVAQYAFAFAGARAVYALAAGEPFTPTGMPEPHLLAAVVAGAAFLVLNNGLVGMAVALRLRVPLWGVVAEDLTWQLMTSAPLLGLGPLAAQAAMWTPASIVLLLIPIIALHRSGVTAMKREQEALRDPLTGLANRTLLASATDRALETGGGTTAMLLIDLDHFKDVNDTLGHAVGDELLLAVAARLTEQAGPDDLVARLGGDEFVVLARRCAGSDAAVALASRIGEAVRQPYQVQGVVLTVGCSVGIGLAPDHVNAVEGLLRCADVALYSAKATRGTYALYDRQTDQHSAALLGLQADLRAALEDPDDEQIYVVYQPQLDLGSGRTCAVECLVRWKHPVLGELFPDSFIPMAESTSLIDLLMRRVLDLALSQMAQWDTEGLEVSVAVNLSARQLSDLTLPDTVADVLARHGLEPKRLQLEVTESRLMSDPERSTGILNRLQVLGVSLSIDDFGTGYSSLAYLQRLCVDELKIDKSFILQLHETGNATIVRSTIELGHNLGLRVVAEGVEDQRSADTLAEMGCDMLQGYFIGRPGRADVVRELMRRTAEQPLVIPSQRRRGELVPTGPRPSPESSVTR
jgi:diguanylate cyclase (GGDEF)-like protein